MVNLASNYNYLTWLLHHSLIGLVVNNINEMSNSVCQSIIQNLYGVISVFSCGWSPNLNFKQENVSVITDIKYFMLVLSDYGINAAWWLPRQILIGQEAENQ